MNSKKKPAKKTPAGSNLSTSAAPVPVAAKPFVKAPKPKAPLKLSIPPILLEGDPDPSAYRKVAPKGVSPSVAEVPKEVGAEPPKQPIAAPVMAVVGGGSEMLSLGELRLLARDPYTLFAQWDLAESEMNRARGRAADGMIVLRVHRRSVEGPVVVEIPVLGGERHEFIPVPHAATPYACLLGYRSVEGRQWFSLAQSETVVTAPDPLAHRTGAAAMMMGRWSALEDFAFQVTEVSSETPVRAPASPAIAPSFAAPPFAAVPAAVQRRVENQPHLEAADLFAVPSSAELIYPPEESWHPGAVPSSAIPMAELTRAASADLPSSPVVLPPEMRKGFWFAVNAEVVVYGSTEPDAAVSLAGRAVKLRPDGSFSFRFSLPDGHFQLPITASSADGMERRGAELLLSRATGITGEVGVHAQDKSLRPPAA